MHAPGLPSAACELWDEAPCGLLVADANGLIVQVNATFCRWLGHAPAELIGIKRFQDLLPMGARVFLQTHWTPLLQMQGSVSEVQLDMNGRDGTRIPMLLNAVRRTRDGQIRDEIAALVASDRKAYERELLAARAKAETAASDLRAAKNALRGLNEQLSAEDRRKDIFLATLAHELRNPLAPMSNLVEVLRGKRPARRARSGPPRSWRARSRKCPIWSTTCSTYRASRRGKSPCGVRGSTLPSCCAWRPMRSCQRSRHAAKR